MARLSGRPFAAALIAVASCFLASSGRVEACGTAACSLSTRSDDTRTGQGRLTVDLSFRYLQQDRRMDGTGPVLVSGSLDPEVLRPRVEFETGRIIPGYHHEWELSGAFTQVDVAYGVSSRLTLVGSLPVWNRKTVDHLFFPGFGAASHEHDGAGVSRQKLTIGGVGDLQVGARYGVRRNLDVGLAVKASSGAYREADEYGGIADPMHQPGSGAWGAVANVQHSGGLGFGRATWTAAATYQHSFENSLGYRIGDERFVSGRLSTPLLSRLSGSLQLKAYHAARNEYRGTGVGSTGAFVVYVAPGLRFKAPAGLGLYGNVQVPVFQHVNENQLGVRAVMQLGVSRTF